MSEGVASSGCQKMWRYMVSQISWNKQEDMGSRGYLHGLSSETVKKNVT